MNKYKFELNREGVSQLMKSEEMQGIIIEYANSALQSLGDGYDQKLHIGKTRANVNVFADSYKAKLDNNKHNTILKAVKR